jgi:hypothetical protein
MNFADVVELEAGEPRECPECGAGVFLRIVFESSVEYEVIGGKGYRLWDSEVEEGEESDWMFYCSCGWEQWGEEE